MSENKIKAPSLQFAEQRAEAVLRSCGITKEAGMALVAALHPRDGFESATGLQIVAAQQMSLHLMSDAANQSFLPAQKHYLKMAGELMSKQIALVDSLHRHRLAMQEEAASTATVIPHEE